MTNGITTVKSGKGDCECCTNKDVDLSLVDGMMMCAACITRTVEAKMTPIKAEEIEVAPSTSPITERLKKAYIDKFNSLMVSEMKHEEIRYHIADQEDMIKVLQAQLQATLDVDDEWSKDLDKAKADALREKDRQYRAKARPKVNSDGTLKIAKPVKPKEDIAEGSKAYESLLEKLTRTGMSREKAEALLKTGGK